MKKTFALLWWVFLLAALPVGIVLMLKWHDERSFYFSLILTGLYFFQSFYHFLQSLNMWEKGLKKKTAWHLIGFLVAAGLCWAMSWIWAMHWMGTTTNPPW